MNNNSPKVLIVDDDADLLEMYEEILQIDGVVLLKAKSGREAVHYCKSHENIQIIISDSDMGGMNGMELLQNLRGHYQTMPLFYLLTGSILVSENEIIKAGGSGLILKPFDLDEILERIKKDIKF